jgi:hypothetical protein
MATHDTMGKNPLWVTAKWYRKLNMPIDAGLGPLTLEQITAFELPQDWQAYTAAVRNSTVKYVEGLKSGDFDRNVAVPAPPGQLVPPPSLPFIPTVGGILIHMLTELSCRAGKIEYIRGLQKISPSW